MTLYVTSWNVPDILAYQGDPHTRRRWTVMAFPHPEQRGRGSVPLLTPPPPLHAQLRTNMIARIRTGQADPAAEAAFFRALTQGWEQAEKQGAFRALTGQPWRLPNAEPLRDGDVLLCGCSLTDARAGLCHRTHFAPFLVRAGFRVILDGVEVAAEAPPG